MPSNIAEGSGRNSKDDFARFLSIACGSCMEAETQILIARDLGYEPADSAKPLLELCRRTEKIINGLRKSLGK